ncbi:MFS transporter [Undibacterium sp. Ji49W]|uniref:MFS transporter n=1 Tax=Undibacterium sp. Ji49W TaxID=3413040 RepID=UPI003BF17055
MTEASITNAATSMSSGRSDRVSSRQAWSAVGAMSMCVGLLIASEFMPVSLLTPIAADLHASSGMAGQAISVSGLFAVPTSLLIASVVARWDRRHVLLGLTMTMLVSLLLIAEAPNFPVLMVARALLGVTIGGFWALSTATIMRLVTAPSVPRALGVLYTGNAVAVAFAAPIGSYMGGLIGWRGVFWALVPFVIINLAWQWYSLPSMPPDAGSVVVSTNAFKLLKRRNLAFAMLAVMLSFAGAFSTFTYLRPFLETRMDVTVTQLSLLLLGMGLAGFAGTYGASALSGRFLYRLLAWLPLALAAATLAFLALAFVHLLWPAALILIIWGTLNAAMPVAWSTWLSLDIADEADAGGGLMVAAIQLAIMLGAAFGGLLLDHVSLSATWIGGAVLLLLASLAVGDGRRLRPAKNDIQH